MTCEVNTDMKLKGSEGATFTHEKHLIHVNDFKSTKGVRKFYCINASPLPLVVILRIQNL